MPPGAAVSRLRVVTTPADPADPPGFLALPPPTPEGDALFESDQAAHGYVMNLTRVWAQQPATKQGLMDLIGMAADGGGLTHRQRSVLVSACASAMGDAYCSLAWGGRLAEAAGADAAAGVLQGDDARLDPSEQALARWARQVARDPNATTLGEVDALRRAGFDDAQIFAVTCFVALRIAFSTVNDALGVHPDHELVERIPAEVARAVTFGRSVGEPPR
jgi:uncharacterized peroxidase-related enzyme